MRLIASAGLLVLMSGSPRFAHAVEGASVDTRTVHSVVIATGGPSNPELRCSGVLVSPNVVLTARHCISRVPRDGAPCAKSFGDPITKPRDFWVSARPTIETGTHWKSVASWDLPERTELCGDDIASLVLASPFEPFEATPARPVLSEVEFVEVVKARRFGMAGFGATSIAGADVGKRRSRFDIPVGCVPGIAGFLCDGALEYVEVGELSGGAGPCNGDSGGAAIADADRGVVFGILSRGGLNDESCSEGIFERTDVWRWLIARSVLRATPAGASPPAWASAALPSSPSIGEMCLGASACGGDASCVSFDGQRSYVCARRCDAGCSANEHCEDAVCAPGGLPVKMSACAAATHGASGYTSGIVAIQVAALLGLGLRRRRAGARS